MDSLAFKLTVRALHLFPGVAIVVGLLMGGLSACESVRQFLQRADQVVAVQSALNGR